MCPVLYDIGIMFFSTDSPGNLKTYSNLIALTEYRGLQLKPDHHSSADATGAISTPRANTRCVALRSGALEAYMLRSKSSSRPSCIVWAMRLSEWYLGEIASCQSTIAEAIPLAKELNDMNELAVALYLGLALARFD
jgi:hypothetical protein